MPDEYLCYSCKKTFSKAPTPPGMRRAISCARTVVVTMWNNERRPSIQTHQRRLLKEAR